MLKMSEAVSDDMWTSHKELCSIIEQHLTNFTEGPNTELETILRKHRQQFVSLLDNPPKSAACRDELCAAVTTGIILPGVGHTILSKELIDEAIIISDMYDLNEYISLQLLCTAQRQMPYHPGLPRGLVAILLYYDGRKAIVSALRILVQSRKGVSWCTQCPDTLTETVTIYTDQLVNSGLLNKIINLLTSLDISKELELLQKNRGIGPPKHHKQILDLFEDTRVNLAGILYSWSAQTGLPKETTLELINYLKNVKIEETSSLDDVTLNLMMALLYALDLSVLHNREDGEELVESLPIVSESGFIADILENLLNTKWECEGLRALALYSFGLALSALRLSPNSLHPPGLLDQDDQLISTSIEMKVFDFMHNILLENKSIYKQEFFYRRMHNLLTDFIELKYSKIMELRAKADETSRTIDMYTQEGLEPPQHLSYDFEMFLLSIAKLYKDNSLGLDLCVEYWGPLDNTMNYSARINGHTVALFKFVRLAGDLIPSSLLQSYLDMITSLANCPVAARQAFNLLKMNNQGSGMSVSWDHFFSSLHRYYSNLRQIQVPRSDMAYMQRSGRLISGIQPREITALMSVLKLMQNVAKHDDMARTALCEHPAWSPMQILLGLVTCSVPVYFKAELLRTLAYLGKSPQTSVQLWGHIENAQILTTIQSTSSYKPRGIQTELDEIESRDEQYPLTRAFLHLLLIISGSGIPKNLGAGTRIPGFDPYLSFIVESVFLKFNSRPYKVPEEKWQIAEECMMLLERYLDQYEPQAEDFPISGKPQTSNPPPGFHIMIQMNTKSEFLRILLYILDESCQILDAYHPFPGKTHLENTVLSCLNLINRTLDLQASFFALLSSTGSSLLLTHASKLLLDINPRTGKPDHMLNIAKYTTYNWLPKHSYSAVKILLWITTVPSSNMQLLSVFTQSPSIKTDIRHGFVECLENDDYTGEDDADSAIINDTKEAILKLLQQCLNHAPPNLAHYLLGFDISKNIEKTSFQQAGMLGFPRTCLHSLIFLLDSGIDKSKCNRPTGSLLKAAYQMLYMLCANLKTSEPVLRFLRSCSDFLSRHLSALPFEDNDVSAALNQMSWLMKTAAIELKITAKNHHSSQFANISKVLLGLSTEANKEAQNTPLTELSHYCTFNQSVTPNDKTQHLLTDLLNHLNFNLSELHSPQWEFFDISMLEVIFKNCSVSMPGSPKLVNIKLLHRTLMNELSTIQSTTVIGQRQLIIQEIEQVLKYAIQYNNHKLLCAATVNYMDSWRQMTEIVFSVAPPDALNNDVRQVLLLEIAQIILKKSVKGSVLKDLSNVSSTCLLMLLINLRHCYILKHKQKILRKDFESSVATDTNITTNTLSIKYILEHILQWMTVSGIDLQKLRINLYGAFLNVIHLIKSQHANSKIDVETHDTGYVGRLDSSRVDIVSSEESTLKEMAVNVISNNGDRFINILCHDLTNGHDISRMLALCCLNTLIDLNAHSMCISYLSRKGYLKHMIDSLIESDNDLIQTLQIKPTNMKPLYLYESKMALLGRIASTHVGAELLLEQNALACLSTMRIFDLRPEPQTLSNNESAASFIPSLSHRFQQILFPALNLCNTILTTLNTDNNSVILQVHNFIFSHFDTVEIILRAGNPFMELGYLNELAHLTSVIARSANLEIKQASQEQSVQLFRLQRIMLTLLPRFVLSDALMRNMPPNKKVVDVYNSIIEEKNNEIKANRLIKIVEIACNLCLYSRNVIANNSVDHHSVGVLFLPCLYDNISSGSEKSGGYGNLEQGPNIGILIKQLSYSIQYFLKEQNALKYLMKQLKNVPDMSTAELSEYLPDRSEMVAVAQGREIALEVLTTQVTLKQQELSQITFLIENCLYLIWAHLDYYMLRSIPNNYPTFINNTIPSAGEVSWNITNKEVSQLSQGLVGVLNEKFCKDLLTTTQIYFTIGVDIFKSFDYLITISLDLPPADICFIESLLRRIKRLIQFVPVK